MKPIFPTSAAAMALAIAGTIPAAHAQVPYIQQTSPADELAGEMRVLAANPTDVQAMIRAGELTLKLDDPTAASGFFARAERIDPNNPRIRAGKGIILLQAGRPGEALRRFAEAEQARGDVRVFAAERGLAYDLIGEQERAQRDYRLALKSGTLNAVGIDETIRRYALSLGISGKRDEALAQIDPLLRRSDRGAWRARAFILAMNGDGRGAEKIAASMMPGGLGQGLQPFFDKLPTLGPADRAFAVHFGEVRTTPQRLADARLAPALAALPPDPDKPVAVAAAAPRPVEVATKPNKREKKRKGEKLVLAVAVPAPTPLPPPPAYQPPAVAMVQPLPSQPTYTPLTRSPTPSVALASNRGSLPSALPVPRRETTQPNRGAAESDVRVSAASDRALAPMVRQPLAADRVEKLPIPPKPAPLDDAVGPYEPIKPAAVAKVAPTPSVPTALPAPVPASPLSIAAVPKAETMPTRASEAPPVAVAVVPKPEAAPERRPEASAPVAVTVTPAPVRETVIAQAVPSKPLPPVPGPVKGEDTILAAIIANITVPGSELDVGTPRAEKPVEAAPEPVKLAEAAKAPARVEPDPAEVQAKAAAERAAADKAESDKALADKKAADKKAADKKLADKKLADKKAADAKKLADAKKAEELKKKNDPKILEPSRIWVQVAGGAYEGDLPKEWAKVREKAPAAFKGKTGWMTPLRATNRVLAGPFKTDAEARAFVNTLAKEGLSGFTFTSEAGQKITRLAGK